MSNNTALTNEYFDIAESLDGDLAGRRAANEYMDNSTAIVHHQHVAVSSVPRLFDQQTYQTMKTTAETAHGILVKVIERYLADPEYRKIYDFDPRLAELILLPRGYDSVLPFARVDTFLNEDTQDMKFCEFNGDGSSGMNENREITNSLPLTATFQEFARRHSVQGCDLFDAWVTAFIRIYSTYEHKVDNPRFAICDYLENGVVDEFYLFADLFKQHGYDCTVADVRDLRFDGEVLRDSEGLPVNAIWRRSVTNDVIDFWDQSQDLINAVREEKVALIGSFAGHIVHDKQIFRTLFMPETAAFLTDEENEFIRNTVPFTAFLDDSQMDVAQVRANKNDWIIKPSDHYGSDNVYAGFDYTQEEWEEIVDKFANGKEGFPFIAQHYIMPYKSRIMPPDFDLKSKTDDEINRESKMYMNLNGLYLYDGVFQGVFSRMGPQPVISKKTEGITAATIWVDMDQKVGLDVC